MKAISEAAIVLYAPELSSGIRAEAPELQPKEGCTALGEEIESTRYLWCKSSVKVLSRGELKN